LAPLTLALSPEAGERGLDGSQNYETPEMERQWLYQSFDNFEKGFLGLSINSLIGLGIERTSLLSSIASD
jgi:hypothetical protein